MFFRPKDPLDEPAQTKIMAAPAPKSAAMPMPPVGSGAAAPVALDGCPAPLAVGLVVPEVVACVVVAVVVPLDDPEVEVPLVADEAPPKAGTPAVAPGSGAAVALAGLRTLQRERQQRPSLPRVERKACAYLSMT